MNSYVLTLVLDSKLEEKAKKTLLEGVTKQFDKVAKEDLWGDRDLAYPIKKATKGYFAHYNLEADPAKLPNIERDLRLNEDLLRYLLTRVD